MTVYISSVRKPKLFANSRMELRRFAIRLKLEDSTIIEDFNFFHIPLSIEEAKQSIRYGAKLVHWKTLLSAICTMKSIIAPERVGGPLRQWSGFFEYDNSVRTRGRK
jgi:hypothetical protein